MKTNAVLSLLFFMAATSQACADTGSTYRRHEGSSTFTRQKKEPDQVIRKDATDGSVMNLNLVEEPSLFIRTYHIVGNTVLTETELSEILQPYSNRILTGSRIHEAGDVLMAAIRAKGVFMAKVYILPQEIHDSTITFNIIEGHLEEADGIVLQNTSDRVNKKTIIDLLTNTLEPGSVISADKYERGILLLNDLPGIKQSSNILYPGLEAGEARIGVATEDENLVTGDLYTDNFGSYVTGQYRVGGTVHINSPTGHGEQITAGGVISDKGTKFAYVDFSYPFLDNGLRAGAAIDYLSYATTEEYDLRGTGFDTDLYVKYPLIRSRMTNLNGLLKYEYHESNDKNNLRDLTEIKVHSGVVGFAGEHHDKLWGGGTSAFRFAGYMGNVNLDGLEAYKSYDAEHADTQGSFIRFEGDVSRLQHIVDNLQTFFAFSWQYTNQHLDSSQSFSLGGPFNMPGYHAGDMFGDKGFNLHGDLRYNFHSLPWHGDFQVSLFYDYGWLQTHTIAVVGGFPVPGAVDTSYHMQSAGVGLSQVWGSVMLEGVLGWQVDNEIPDHLLDDSGEDDFLAWLHIVYLF